MMMMTMRITILFVSVSSLLIVSVELFAPVPERPRRMTHPNTVPLSNIIPRHSQPSPTRYAHAPFQQELEHHHLPWFHGLFPRRPRPPLVALPPHPIVTLPQTRTQQPATIEEPYVLSAFETKCLLRLEKLYSKALSMKCPFLRRRATDSLDALEKATRLLLIRDRSLDLIGPPIGLRCKGKTCIKNPGLAMEQKYDLILQDWKVDTHKGYYITGRLNTSLYRDDCLFDGPDPDMPIQGLRKYLNVASQLFDQHSSRSELLKLEIKGETIVADWKMNGILRLPWHPRLPEWTGQTTYHFDENGLVYLHTETWDMSVTHAFLKTLWPELARRLWPTDDDDTNNIDNKLEEEEEEEECNLV